MSGVLKIKENFNINPFIHSVFGEMLATVIYDGTWVGKDSPVPNINGIRKDVIDGLKEAGVTAIRWPGGCAADWYHWKDGIGPVRKNRMTLPDQGNEFGTDEFMELCRLVGAEPILVANVASGTPEEFADWFEYCNGGTDTKYGALRAEYGHVEPYNVKFWGIGNTDHNVWHIARNDPKEYAKDFLRWKTTIYYHKDKVKLIGLGLSERHEIPGWVEECLDYITNGQRVAGPDYLSVHHYVGGMKTRYKKSEGAVEYSDDAYYYALDSVKAYQKDIDLHRGYIKEHTNPKYTTKICFDEWGMWHPEATNEVDQRQIQTMRDGLFAALSFHTFYRNCDIVDFAMETQYSNLLQCLFRTDGAQFVKTPTFYVFKLYKEHLGNYLTDIEIAQDNPMIDAVCSTNQDKTKVVISIVNKHLTDSFSLVIPEALKEYKITDASVIAPDDVRTYNTYENPMEICDVEFTQYTKESVIVPKHSITRLVFTQID